MNNRQVPNSAFYKGPTRYGGSSAIAKRREAARRRTLFTSTIPATNTTTSRVTIPSFQAVLNEQPRASTSRMVDSTSSMIAPRPSTSSGYTLNINSAAIVRNEPQEPQISSSAKRILNWIEENSVPSQRGEDDTVFRTRRIRPRFNPMSYIAPSNARISTMPMDPKLPVKSSLPPITTTTTVNTKPAQPIQVPMLKFNNLAPLTNGPSNNFKAPEPKVEADPSPRFSQPKFCGPKYKVEDIKCEPRTFAEPKNMNNTEPAQNHQGSPNVEKVEIRSKKRKEPETPFSPPSKTYPKLPVKSSLPPIAIKTIVNTKPAQPTQLPLLNFNNSATLTNGPSNNPKAPEPKVEADPSPRFSRPKFCGPANKVEEVRCETKTFARPIDLSKTSQTQRHQEQHSVEQVEIRSEKRKEPETPFSIPPTMSTKQPMKSALPPISTTTTIDTKPAQPTQAPLLNFSNPAPLTNGPQNSFKAPEPKILADSSSPFSQANLFGPTNKVEEVKSETKTFAGLKDLNQLPHTQDHQEKPSVEEVDIKSEKRKEPETPFSIAPITTSTQTTTTSTTTTVTTTSTTSEFDVEMEMDIEMPPVSQPQPPTSLFGQTIPSAPIPSLTPSTPSTPSLPTTTQPITNILTGTTQQQSVFIPTPTFSATGFTAPVLPPIPTINNMPTTNGANPFAPPPSSSIRGRKTLRATRRLPR